MKSVDRYGKLFVHRSDGQARRMMATGIEQMTQVSSFYQGSRDRGSFGDKKSAVNEV